MSAGRLYFRAPLAALLGAAALAGLALSGCSAGRITAPRYVLSYGISDYSDGNDLTTPVKDAETIRDILVSQGYVERSLRTNADATKGNISGDITGLSSLERDSIIFIFFSLHGTYDMTNDISYLALDSSIYISPAELSSWIAQSGQRNVIVIIHTCYSGGFVDPGSSIDIAPQNYGPNDWGTAPPAVWAALGKFGELLTKNAESSGAPAPIVISAAGSNESAWESPDPYFEGHAVFPYFLFEAAQHGDANSDGFVTATEAYAYAVSGVKLYWNYYYQNLYPEQDPNQGNIYVYPDFMPHISGGSRDLVLFQD